MENWLMDQKLTLLAGLVVFCLSFLVSLFSQTIATVMVWGSLGFFGLSTLPVVKRELKEFYAELVKK